MFTRESFLQGIVTLAARVPCPDGARRGGTQRTLPGRCEKQTHFRRERCIC